MRIDQLQLGRLKKIKSLIDGYGKQWKELYGTELPPNPTKRSDTSTEAEEAARERGDLFLLIKKRCIDFLSK